MKKLALMIFFAFFSFLMVSCVNFTREYKEVYYYHVDYAPPAIEGTPVKDITVRLGSFNAASSFQSLKIIYSTSKYRRKTYEYHHWLVSPSDMISELLHRDMAASKLYGAVVTVRSSLPPQYELEGTIEEIMERDEGDVWFSVISMRCAAFAFPEKIGKKKVLYQKAYKESIRTEKNSPGAVVAAMSEAMEKISVKIQKDLNAAIAAHEASKEKGEY